MASAQPGKNFSATCPFQNFWRPLQFRFGIATTGEEMPQRQVLFADGFEHIGLPLAVLNIDRKNSNPDKVPKHIVEDMALAFLTLLLRIKAMRPNRPYCFQRLAIDHARS